MSDDTEFWMTNPKSLFNSPSVLPTRYMTNAELLNTITRLIILMSLLLFIVGYTHWWVFLIGGVIMMILIWYFTMKQSMNVTRVENLRCRVGRRLCNKDRLIVVDNINYKQETYRIIPKYN